MGNRSISNYQIIKSSNHQIALWLLSGAFLIFIMVVVGGITRLTGSGLSITEWQPIMGAIPPLNEQQWQEAFDKYQQIPQFQKLNYHFTLDDFKRIFFWEYLHRLIGRFIGIVFLGGFVYFLWKKQLNGEWIKKSLFLFALGGLQGFIGWYMVSSGLIERTSVSHYRLAVHLITAFITFGFCLWFAMQLLYPRNSVILNEVKNPSDRKGFFVKTQNDIRKLLIVIFLFLFIQLIYGAFTAGLHAGRIANTFPTMDGEWVPSALTVMQPAYINFFENLLTVQFVHRSLAWLLLVLISILFFSTRNKALSTFQSRSITFVFIGLLIQFLLGVFTILYKAPVVLSALHQIGGFFLFSTTIVALFAFRSAGNKT